jgi:hypothetical protein
MTLFIGNIPLQLNAEGERNYSYNYSWMVGYFEKKYATAISDNCKNTNEFDFIYIYIS